MTARLTVVGLTVAMASACAYHPKTTDAKRPIEKAIVLVEKGDGEPDHALSQTKLDPGPATHVPQSTPVDVNSTIAIRIGRDELLAAAGGAADPTSGIDIEKSRKDLTAALQAIDEIVALHQLALAAYEAASAIPVEELPGTAELEEFFARRRTHASLRRRTRGALLGVWDEASAEGQVVVAAFRSNDYRPLQRVVQDKLDAFERAAGAAVRRVTEDDLALRIEAFLTASDAGVDATPSAVHVEGYDRLPEGRLQRRDRLGLRLGPRERQRLADLTQASSDIAAAAERVRLHEKTVEEAFSQTTTQLGSRLGELVTQMDELRKRFGSRRFSADGIASELAQLWSDLRNDPALRVDLNALPTTLAQDLGAAGAAAVELLALVDDVKSLQKEWDARGVAALPQILSRAQGLVERARDVGLRIRDTSTWRDAATRLPSAVASLAAPLVDRVSERVRASAAWQRVEELAGDLDRARSIALRIAALFGGVTEAPLPQLRTPDSFAVRLEDVSDTSIDLERADRLPGDVLSIRTTLFRGEDEIASTVSTLELVEFGYHASLEPSVVLARPSRLRGGSQGWTFSPALSWLHHYSPRPEDESWFAPGMRALDPALGLHAALLNSSPDREVEIGLGTTLGLWQGRMQFGAGYNFMADRAADGRVYFFVGSSLIPLLQALGFGGERKSGAHP